MTDLDPDDVAAYLLRDHAKRPDLTPADQAAIARAARLVRRPPGPAREPRPKPSRPVAVRKPRGPAPSRFPEDVRQQAVARSGGRCEVCGDPATEVHHRRGAGMGGDRRPEARAITNALVVCGHGNADGCHGWIEGHATQAEALGLKIPRHADPATIPAQLRRGLVWLTPDGGYSDTPPSP